MNTSICRHDKKELVLHFYGELDEAASAEIAARLVVCPSCRDYLTQLSGLESVMPRSPSIDPDEAVMDAVRAATARRLREVEGRRSARTTRFPLPAAAWARLTVSATVLAAVFLIGRWSVEPESRTNGGAVSDVSDIEYNAATGSISVRYNTVDASAVEGTIRDDRVRTLLVHALAEGGSPATRFRAVKLLNDLDVERIQPDDRFIDALIKILREDQNEGMQLQAIRALRRILSGAALDDVLTDLLMGVLGTAGNSAVRIEALEMLTESELARQDLNLVLDQAARDENSFIRFKARSTLDELQRAAGSGEPEATRPEGLEGSVPLEGIN